MTDVATRWQVGAVLGPLEKVMTREAMANEVMAGNNPIHYDDAFARSVGLPAPIATGMISTGYLTQLLLEAFGIHWLAGGRISVSFVKPVFAGDTVLAQAVVRERTENAAAIHLALDVWCANQRSEEVTIGTASVTLPRAAP